MVNMRVSIYALFAGVFKLGCGSYVLRIWDDVTFHNNLREEGGI
jgi:hypothetical protein